MPEQNQPITSLPIKTSSGMAATDYLLGIDSAEGYQMLIQDLGDYIIQHATSLLAGQSQTLASVISVLSSNLTGLVGWKSSGSFNDLRKSGLYMTSNLTDRPNVSGISTWAVQVLSSGAIGIDGNTVKQVAYGANGNKIYTRQLVAGTWSAWTLQPTRDEVDALNSNTSTVTYASLASLYNAGINLAATHTSQFVIISTDVTAALTNNQASGVCRGFITKADNATVDVFMYGIATEKLFISRVTSASTVSKCIIYRGTTA